MRKISSVAEHFRAIERLHWSEILFWIAVFAAYFMPDANYVLMTQVMVWGAFAMSLDLLIGFRNIPSLGHAAFFGTGAYVAGMLGKQGLGDPLAGLAIAGLVTGLVGLGVGTVIRKLNGFAILMVTLIFNLLLEEIVLKARAITGGDDGLQGITIEPILGLFRFDLYGKTGYLYVAVIALILTMLLRRVMSSPWGLRVQAARTNARRLAALGVEAQRDTIWLVGLAALVAGVAGALMAQTSQFVSTDVLAFHRSADALIIVIIGGAGTLYGGFIGAAVYITLRDIFASINPVYWYFWVGLLLLTVVAFFKRGIVPTIAGGLSYLGRYFSAKKETRHG